MQDGYISPHANRLPRWLNRTVLGIGLASLFSDLSHETVTAVLPAFMASLGASAAALGAIEGTADAVSSLAKLGGGWLADRLPRRKPLAAFGYVLTGLAMGAMALAYNAWSAGAARALGWFGRGIRTPSRKALLSAAVSSEYYGRAFGFERALDETGGLLGAASAWFFLQYLHWDYVRIFAWTLVPGFLAAGAIFFLVKEARRVTVIKMSFVHSLRELPPVFRRFLLGVALFGAGDFSKAMLILLAAQSLAPALGPVKAAATASALYVLHKVFYMAVSYPAGHLGDRFSKPVMLAIFYLLAMVMGLVLIFAPMNLPVLCVVFILAGVYVAGQDALEDALAASLMEKDRHGTAFGTLATVNGMGDFVSSLAVGVLWTRFSPAVAFAFATILFALGTLVIWRLPRQSSVPPRTIPLPGRS